MTIKTVMKQLRLDKGFVFPIWLKWHVTTH